MAIAAGEKIPSVKVMYMGPEGPASMSSDELFGGKRVAVFGLPGAFTPVCSAQHLPGYVKRADALTEKGIDMIACVSVNDPFVMKAWGEAHNVGDKVMMVADAAGDMARAIGLALDLSEYGLGERSERYSMIVDDGTVMTINVEKSILDHDVSSVDNLIAQA